MASFYGITQKASTSTQNNPVVSNAGLSARPIGMRLARIGYIHGQAEPKSLDDRGYRGTASSPDKLAELTE